MSNRPGTRGLIFNEVNLWEKSREGRCAISLPKADVERSTLDPKLTGDTPELPQLSELDVLRVFAGIRVRTEDGTPIAGAVSETPGLWLATGFASDGICLAPLIGREMSNLMLGRETLPEFEEFSPARFADLEAGA